MNFSFHQIQCFTGFKTSHYVYCLQQNQDMLYFSFMSVLMIGRRLFSTTQTVTLEKPASLLKLSLGL